MREVSFPLSNAPGEVTLSPTSARLLRLIRIAWYGLALFLVSVFAVGTVLRYSDMQQPCTASLEVCMQTLRLRPVNLQGLESPEAALRFYAIFYTVEQVSIRLLVWAVSAFIFWRRRDDWTALLVSFWLLTLGPPFSEYAAAQHWPWLFVPLMGMGVVSAVCSNLFLFVFPNGRFVPRWTRWPAFTFIALNALMVLMPALSTQMTQTVWAGLGLIFLYGFVFFSQIYRYRNVSNTTERQQTKWVVFGMALAAFFLVGTRLWIGLDWNPDEQISAKFYLTVLGFVIHTITIPITLGIAILRYRLFDIDLLINRTLVYGALTAFVIGAYALVVGAVGALLRVESNVVLSLVATGLVAVAFHPLRERLQRAVNRLMYGERDEPYAVLTRLGRRLEAAIESSAALPLTVETVAHALKLPYVGIQLIGGRSSAISAEWGERPPSTGHSSLVTLPLIYAGETIGELVAASRAPDEPLTEADRRLLSDLARQIGVTAHAILLAADLERARLRIVTAREETRRRLGSDLHDGVGHQLAGLARKAELATNLLERDPTAARVMLAEVTQQLNIAITQVRRLAHQLHPPELELLGLVGALRERAQVQSNFAIRVDAPDSLPPLPTAVETAAYYVALEALTNVEKHAGAKSCHIHLALVDSDPPVLEMDIADDGRGLSPQTAGGLGLLSMQARAVEVGGLCRIESTSQGGARVSVRLPCPAQLE